MELATPVRNHQNNSRCLLVVVVVVQQPPAKILAVGAKNVAGICLENVNCQPHDAGSVRHAANLAMSADHDAAPV